MRFVLLSLLVRYAQKRRISLLWSMSVNGKSAQTVRQRTATEKAKSAPTQFNCTIYDGAKLIPSDSKATILNGFD